MPKLSFLTENADFSVDLPADHGDDPMLGTVVALRGVAREMTYRPKARYADPDSYADWQAVTTMERSGVQISVYRRPAIVTSLVIVWRLELGYLTTFVEEPDPGMDGIVELADNVEISARGSAFPRVEFSGPVTAADQKDPVNRDSVIFFVTNPQPGQADQYRLYLERRGAKRGKGVRESDGATEATATQGGLTVSLVVTPGASGGAESEAQTIAATVAPA